MNNYAKLKKLTDELNNFKNSLPNYGDTISTLKVVKAIEKILGSVNNE